MRKTTITVLTFLSSVANAQILPSAIECQVDYNFARARVFEARCIGCHSGPKAKAGVDLSQFSTAAAHLTAIENVVRNDEMPPTSSLSPEEAEIVLAWISQGAQETAPAESVCIN